MTPTRSPINDANDSKCLCHPGIDISNLISNILYKACEEIEVLEAEVKRLDSLVKKYQRKDAKLKEEMKKFNEGFAYKAKKKKT